MDFCNTYIQVQMESSKCTGFNLVIIPFKGPNSYLTLLVLI